MAVTDKDIADLMARAVDANAALMRGDIEGYLALISHADPLVRGIGLEQAAPIARG